MWSIHGPMQLHSLAETVRDPSDHNAAKRFPCSDFWRSCSWSPDGTALLAVHDDNQAHVFPVPSQAAAAVLAEPDCTAVTPCALKPSISVHTGENSYDAQWYPACNFQMAQTACFAETTRGKPVSLWDANTGLLRCTYRTYDNTDEVTACHSLCFHNDCERLVGGLKGRLSIWQLARPGRDHDTLPLQLQGRSAGIASAIDCAPQGDLLAVGTFTALVALIDVRSFEQVSSVIGHAHGIVQVKFSRCGNFVYSRARKDGNISGWDLRYTGERLYDLHVPQTLTNQRLWFDIEPCGRHLLAGGSTGSVFMFDLSTGTLAQEMAAAPDTISSVGLHGTLPLVATTSGHRRFWDDEEMQWDDGPVPLGSNSLRIWHLQSSSARESGNEDQPKSPSLDA
eukprot:jgi/Ulvmu1/6177/UM028_0033.1